MKIPGLGLTPTLSDIQVWCDNIRADPSIRPKFPELPNGRKCCGRSGKNLKILKVPKCEKSYRNLGKSGAG